MSTLYVDIQSVLLKIYNYFSVYTVRTESFKTFAILWIVNVRKCITVRQDRCHFLFFAVEWLLHMSSALINILLYLSVKPPVVMKTYFENSFSEICSFMNMYETNVVAQHREGTPVTEMQTILHTSTAERLASKFVTHKNQTFSDTNVGRWLQRRMQRFLSAHGRTLHF